MPVTVGYDNSNVMPVTVGYDNSNVMHITVHQQLYLKNHISWRENIIT